MKPYDFIESFAKAHESRSVDAADELNFWLMHGYLFKSPHYFLIFGEDPDYPNPDVWFVYWAEMAPDFRSSCFSHMWLASIAALLDLMPYKRPKIKFNRGLRGNFDGRIYSTDRLLRLIYGAKH
jgi:hypothetical protein